MIDMGDTRAEQGPLQVPKTSQLQIDAAEYLKGNAAFWDGKTLFISVTTWTELNNAPTAATRRAILDSLKIAATRTFADSGRLKRN